VAKIKPGPLGRNIREKKEIKGEEETIFSRRNSLLPCLSSEKRTLSE